MLDVKVNWPAGSVRSGGHKAATIYLGERLDVNKFRHFRKFLSKVNGLFTTFGEMCGNW